MSDLFERVRSWQSALNVFNPVSQVLPMVEECAEYEDATSDEARKDAIGGMAVTAIVEYTALAMQFGFDDDRIEARQVSPVSYSILKCLGLIAEGVRKPKKAHQALEGCLSLLQVTKQLAVKHGYDFEKDCLGPVVVIIEARLKEGYTMNAGTAVKAGDS